MRRDRAELLRAEGNELRKVANIAAAIDRRETRFVDVIKSMVSYVEAFCFQTNVSFVDERIKNTVEDTMFFGLLLM